MAHPWHEDCITVIRKHPNVYADVSGQFYRPWQMYNGMRLAFEWDVMHKLLFASDWPLTTPQETIDHLIDCVLTDTESDDSLAVAVNTHLACFAAAKSATNGSPVVQITENLSD